MEHVCWFIGGYVIGLIIAYVIFKISRKILGSIQVDESDPEDVKWRFVIENDVDFSKTKFITLKVENVDLSHE